MAGARETALLALERCRREGAWPDAVLPGLIEAAQLDSRDAALATRLCYGVQQQLLLLDYCIDSYSKTKKLQPKLLDILRLSCYQLLFMDRVPDRAAVSEGVALAKQAQPQAAGLVNAVLRRVSENKESLLGVEALDIRYSHPKWLVDELISVFGQAEAEKLMAANNADAPVTLHVNTLRTDAATLASRLGGELHPWLPDAIVLKSAAGLSDVIGSGLGFVQDAAAKCAVIAAAPKAGMTILDACAAPGGKSFTAAIMAEDKAEITSCDIHEKKLKRITDGAERLGLRSIGTRQMDARRAEGSYALVLADVPCSGLGVIRKKPDIRYKPQSELERLPEIQLELLCGLSGAVAPGGALLYSTCTVLKRENEGVIESFLSENSDFSTESFELPYIGRVDSGMITLLPHIHNTDGFFICRLRKK